MRLTGRSAAIVAVVVGLVVVTAGTAHADYGGTLRSTDRSSAGYAGGELGYTVRELTDHTGWVTGVLRDKRVDGRCAYVKFERIGWSGRASNAKEFWVCDVWGYRTRVVGYSTYTSYLHMDGVRITVCRIALGLRGPENCSRRDLTTHTA